MEKEVSAIELIIRVDDYRWTVAKAVQVRDELNRRLAEVAEWQKRLTETKEDGE